MTNTGRDPVSMHVLAFGHRSMMAKT